MPDLIDLGAHLYEVYEFEETKNLGPEQHDEVLKGAYESREENKCTIPDI